MLSPAIIHGPIIQFIIHKQHYIVYIITIQDNEYYIHITASIPTYNLYLHILYNLYMCMCVAEAVYNNLYKWCNDNNNITKLYVYVDMYIIVLYFRSQ